MFFLLLIKFKQYQLNFLSYMRFSSNDIVVQTILLYLQI